MVGRRPRTVNSATDWHGTMPSRQPSSIRRRYRDDDEEAGLPPNVSPGDHHGPPSTEPTSTQSTIAAPTLRPSPREIQIHDDRAKVTSFSGFKDARHLAIAEQRRIDLKQRVLDGMKGLSSWDGHYRKSDAELKAIKNKKIRRYYESQNETLDSWVEVDALVMAVADDVIDSMNPDADRDGIAERRVPLADSKGAVEAFLPPEHIEKRRRDERNAKWAINTNVIANVFMLIGKLVSLRFSPSLSLAASTADSALDLFCTLIIYSTNRIVSWRLRALRLKYPVGRRRLEPIGILVFSVIMVVSFLQILQESVKKLLPGGDRDVAPLPPVAIGAMAANAIIKGIIGLICRPIKTTQVQALVQDCKTDVYFNTASLLFPLIGVAAQIWWLDPLGATLLALYVICDWAETCIENISRLTGSSVDDALQKKLMYLGFRFSPVVAGFKTLTAYHAGDGVWVELDILLDESTSLPLAHDISETLQYCYESLQEVDRAFVTVDYSTLGPTGHNECD
ncbi:uncharacterized protein B0T23DRAFT_135772 [Neurospora hispaniola]|uniref:Cation efflux protein transmembrane domain-containing protein n=1 Tax=Neurospora hispaniola TaxID=588809 RepID=A0AAJ0I7E5_9PEZI|nr:hypothetical protein B0T23DRAFT_135772 [Neurospora hispaniola]